LIVPSESAPPLEIRLDRAARCLHVDFGPAGRFALSAELLRVESPSAEVQGHAPSERKTVPGKRGVGIKAVEPVGRYAVRLIFDDSHDTGIYTWDYLRQLGVEQARRWDHYLDALASKGLSRD